MAFGLGLGICEVGCESIYDLMVKARNTFNWFSEESDKKLDDGLLFLFVLLCRIGYGPFLCGLYGKVVLFL